MHHPFVAWITVPVLLIFGIYAVSRLADGMDGFWRGAQSKWPSGSAARRHGVGYLLVLIAAFELLGVSIAHLIIGFGLAGVVLGIAAQQSSQYFRLLVLLFARPFNVVSTSVFARHDRRRRRLVLGIGSPT